MLLVGLTGNIASGKSTAAHLFSERGATIIDADVLARRAVETGTPAHRRIVERWGTAVLQSDGSLDRAALRRRVFSDPEALDELNSIVHPEVARLRTRLVKDRNLKETEAMDMIAAQMPAELKRAGADFCVDNDSTITALEAKIIEVWQALDAEAAEKEKAGVS